MNEWYTKAEDTYLTALIAASLVMGVVLLINMWKEYKLRQARKR